MNENEGLSTPASLQDQFDQLIRAFEKEILYLRKLEKEKKNLEKENSELKLANQALNKELKQTQKNQDNIPANFQNSEILAKIVSDKLKETGSVAELKEILDEYIRGIERCIAFLNG